MHASFKIISFLRQTAPNLTLDFHLVPGLEDMPFPLPTKDDVLSFLTRYPDAPRHILADPSIKTLTGLVRRRL